MCRHAQRQTTHTAPTLPPHLDCGGIGETDSRCFRAALWHYRLVYCYPERVVEPGSPNVTPEQDASFGTRLKRLREAAGLTQEELASRAGLTAKAIGAPLPPG